MMLLSQHTTSTTKNGIQCLLSFIIIVLALSCSRSKHRLHYQLFCNAFVPPSTTIRSTLVQNKFSTVISMHFPTKRPVPVLVLQRTSIIPITIHFSNHQSHASSLRFSVTANTRLYKQHSSNDDPNSNSENDVSSSFSLHSLGVDLNLSRRDAALLGLGGIAYGKLVGDAISRLKRGDAYPPEHERRVSDVFQKAIVEASNAVSFSPSDDDSFGRPLKVLEVGIGSSCRTVARGVYDAALKRLQTDDSSDGSSTSRKRRVGFDLLGVDIDVPNSDTLDKARNRFSSIVNQMEVENELSSLSSPKPFKASFDVVNADLTKKLDFPDGYFDVITCSLVLCSVSNQKMAIEEIKRLLNPNGGTFGYVEHVAVNLENENEKNRKFLEWEQRVLDPLQQAVAHNCHLHRDTDVAILETFIKAGASRADMLQMERFYIDDMWPVSCQCSGVIQLNTY